MIGSKRKEAIMEGAEMKIMRVFTMSNTEKKYKHIRERDEEDQRK